MAIRGEGVVETLHTLLALCYREPRPHLRARIATGSITEQEFLGQIFSHVDLRGTRLPPEAEAR